MGFAGLADAGPTAGNPAPAPSAEIGAVDYETICAAMMATDRGRWFLSEFARRNRAADTAAVLDAIDRLAASHYSRDATTPVDRPPPDRPPAGPSDGLSPAAAVADIAELHAELAGMADAIARLKSRPAPESPANALPDDSTSEDPFAFAVSNQHVSAIIGAAEQVQDVAWAMRRQSIAAALCDRLALCAGELLGACTQLDLARRSVREIVNVLRYLDDRIDALTGGWSEPAAPASSIASDIATAPDAPAVAGAAMPVAPAIPVADCTATMPVVVAAARLVADPALLAEPAARGAVSTEQAEPRPPRRLRLRFRSSWCWPRKRSRARCRSRSSRRNRPSRLPRRLPWRYPIPGY